jgi:effector-binding domain-containing protein
VDSPVETFAGHARPTAVVSVTTTWAKFRAEWPAMLEEAREVVGPREAGLNVMLYLSDEPKVEVGVLADFPFQPAGRVVRSELPAGRVARTVHRGSYDELGVSHQAVKDYCAAQGLTLAGPNWEIYGHWTDDVARVETEICYLLAE